MDVRQFTIEDGLVPAQAALESNRPSEPACGVIVNTSGGAVQDQEAGWDFGDLLAELSGGGDSGDLCCLLFLILSVICVCRFSKCRLDALRLIKTGHNSGLKLVVLRAM